MSQPQQQWMIISFGLLALLVYVMTRPVAVVEDDDEPIVVERIHDRHYPLPYSMYYGRGLRGMRGGHRRRRHSGYDFTA